MTLKKISTFIFSLILVSLFLAPNILLAQTTPPVENNPVGLLKRAGTFSGYNSLTDELTMSQFIGRIIMVALSLLGVIFLVLTVYAGYLWFTAGGDDKKVEKAKEYLKNGVIGLVIVLASVSITAFVLGRLLNTGIISNPSPTLTP
ncbi:MAG: pilin [Candidatus Magasanikbacteria bacterium]|nr:pilin [Candidatus Magasanikbacteria bacterium]